MFIRRIDEKLSLRNKERRKLTKLTLSKDVFRKDLIDLAEK